MAQAIIKDTKLKLYFEIGMDDKGEPVYQTKTYSNIKKESTPDKLAEVAQVLGGLCEHPLLGVEKLDNFDIVM